MQFHIEPELRDELASLAERRNMPMAELIREAIVDFIAREAPPQEADPALEIIGMIDWPDVPVDAAENHDSHIYREDWQGLRLMHCRSLVDLIAPFLFAGPTYSPARSLVIRLFLHEHVTQVSIDLTHKCGLARHLPGQTQPKL